MREYYDRNAQNMIESTLKLDLKPIYDKFEQYLKPGEKLLDVGFGSGRDSLHFSGAHYVVVSIDDAPEVVKRGKTLLNNEVLEVDVRDIRYEKEFGAIWASAILFHFETEEIKEILKSFHRALKDQGVLYMSFKYGKNVRIKGERIFNDFDEEKFAEMMSGVEGFEVMDVWKTEDARPDHEDKFWLNAILRKK